MKKVKTFIISSFFICFSCFEAPRECKNFKIGKFRFDFEVNGQKKTTFFERFETIEIETFEGKTDTSTVRWVNDCEYILQKKHPKSSQEKKAISMRILNTSKNSYTFEFGIVGSNKKQIGTAIQLK
jgi:hypothetical protein